MTVKTLSLLDPAALVADSVAEWRKARVNKLRDCLALWHHPLPPQRGNP
jgi:hypothetical protein